MEEVTVENCSLTGEVTEKGEVRDGGQRKHKGKSWRQ